MSKPTPPAAAPTPAAPEPIKPEDRYIPGDPIPVAEAVESDTESAWARFSEMPEDDDNEFPETQVAPL